MRTPSSRDRAPDHVQRIMIVARTRSRPGRDTEIVVGAPTVAGAAATV